MDGSSSADDEGGEDTVRSISKSVKKLQDKLAKVLQNRNNKKSVKRPKKKSKPNEGDKEVDLTSKTYVLLKYCKLTIMLFVIP